MTSATLPIVSSGRFSAMIAEASLKHGATVWHIHTPAAQLPYSRLARFDLGATEPEAELARLAELQGEWRTVSDRLHLVPLADGTVADLRRKPGTCALRATDRRGVSGNGRLRLRAPADPGKINSQAESIIIHALRTPKVIQSVRDWAPHLFLVGFKLLSRVPWASCSPKRSPPAWPTAPT